MTFNSKCKSTSIPSLSNVIIGQMCSNIPQTRYLCDLLDVKYDSKIDINGFNDYKLPLFDGDSDGFGSKTGGLRGKFFFDYKT